MWTIIHSLSAFLFSLKAWKTSSRTGKAGLTEMQGRGKFCDAGIHVRGSRREWTWQQVDPPRQEHNRPPCQGHPWKEWRRGLVRYWLSQECYRSIFFTLVEAGSIASASRSGLLYDSRDAEMWNNRPASSPWESRRGCSRRAWTVPAAAASAFR